MRISRSSSSKSDFLQRADPGHVDGAIQAHAVRPAPAYDRIGPSERKVAPIRPIKIR